MLPLHPPMHDVALNYQFDMPLKRYSVDNYQETDLIFYHRHYIQHLIG